MTKKQPQILPPERAIQRARPVEPERKRRRRDGVYKRPGSKEWWGSWTEMVGGKSKRVRQNLQTENYAAAVEEVMYRRRRAKTLRATGKADASKDALSTVFARYRQHQKVRLSPESYARMTNILDLHIEPYFGAVSIKDITRDLVSQYASQRAEKASAATVAKELNCLRHMLNLMVTEWNLLPFNPASRVKPPRKPADGRMRVLQPTEVRAVLNECPAWLRGIVGLAVFTGMRRGEILGLRWINIDLPGKRLFLTQTKNGESRVVYLNSLALEVLKSQWTEKAVPGDLVFPQVAGFSPDNVSKGFATVARRLKIADIHFHDLRRTAASWMRMQGVDAHTVAEVLGHRDMRVARIYQRLGPDYLSAAMNRLDAVFAEPKQLS